jgi:hypothetical protein
VPYNGPAAQRQSKSALTLKQQRFVEEYLVDLNATQAAIRAGGDWHRDRLLRIDIRRERLHRVSLSRARD